MATHSLTDCAHGVSVFDWARVAFRMQAMEEGKTVISMNYSGAVENEQLDDFRKVMDKLKAEFHMVETSEATVNKWTRSGKQDTGRLDFNSGFISAETIVKVGFDGKEASVAIDSFERDRAKSIIDWFSPLLKKKSQRQGRACTLLMDQSIYVSDLGPAGEPLVRENYDKTVLDGFDFLVKDLAAESPRGRLAILDGPPGTGKSYFVRALINEIENSIFLIVPSSLVGHISEPNFMPAIIDLHEEEQVPIIMVLEDADAALLPRGVDNMSTISDLLNFADGIVGKIIDFRIIATTNAKRLEIEPALMRKGRLSRHVHIGKLELEHARNVFERLTGVKPSAAHEEKLLKATLADVYDLSHDYLEKVEKNDRRD